MKDGTFTADCLLALYDSVVDAEDAIPRLRRFVLDLAVRGKLVKEDPSDEPAAELLKRIAKEKARLVKAGDIAASNSVNLPSSRELVFAIPDHWQPAFVANILNELQTGPFGSSLHQSDYRIGGTPVVNPASIQNKRIVPIDKMAVGEETLARLASFMLRSGDIVMARRGEMGRCAIVSEREAGWLCGTGSLILRPSSLLDARFLVLVIGSPFGRDYLGSSSVGATMQNLNQTILLNLPLGLPPLAEQQRIVAKVDELMALCDQLQAARAGREAVRDRLTAATWARLTAPETDAETFSTHALAALETLTTLTTRPDQIKTLRQTILNLAVRGKLVEQDPSDEPAAELLKRVAIERRNLRAAKGALTSINEEKFPLPSGWVWTPFGNLVLSSDAGWSPKTLDHPRREGEWGVLKVSAVSWDQFDASANKQVTPGTQPRLQAQVRQGDFLISRANTAELIARAVLVEAEPDRLMMSDKIVRLRLTEHTAPKYLWAVNNHADFAREHYFSKATGVSPSMKNVSRDVILNLPVPLPPLAEQHRIVARVDALMAFCDQLEASLTTTTTTRSRLLEALLHEALQGKEAA